MADKTDPPPASGEVSRAIPAAVEDAGEIMHPTTPGLYPTLWTLDNRQLIRYKFPFHEMVVNQKFIECIRMNKFTLRHLWTAMYVRLKGTPDAINKWPPLGMAALEKKGLAALAPILPGTYKTDHSIRDALLTHLILHGGEIEALGFVFYKLVKWEDAEALINGDSFELADLLRLPLTKFDPHDSEMAMGAPDPMKALLYAKINDEKHSLQPNAGLVQRQEGR